MEALWPLFRAVATTGEPAWAALVAALHPQLVTLAGRQPLGRLRRNDDTRYDIATHVLERLRARDFAAIAKLCATDQPPPLEAWIRVLVRRAAIDYLRASPEYVRATPERDARWVTLQSLVSSTPDRAPSTLAEKRVQLLSFVRDAVAQAAAADAAHGDEALGRLAAAWSVSRTHVRRLIQRGPELVGVLERVLAGQSFPEVAAALGRTRREVELAVHYLEEFLTARGFPR